MTTPLAVILRTLREQRVLTQRQLAEQSGINRATLQNLELSRVTRPWRHVIDALADALGVEPDTLTTEVFDPAHPKQPRPDETVSPIGARLRELRQARGYSQEALASRAGLSRQGIQKLEGGSTHVKRSTVHQLAEALGVTVEELAPNAPPPPPPVHVPAPPPVSHPGLLALAEAVQAHDPLAEVAIDHDGPAVAAWLSTGELCYFWNRHSWAAYLREHGLDLTTDLPDIVNPFRREQTAEAKRALNALVRG